MAFKYPVDENDHVQGLKDAKITLVEYGDYECSYCGEAYSVLKDVQKKLGDDLRFVFRNFPLNNIHPHAVHAAMAAEAAGKFGKYFEMHDKLYENQVALKDRDLIKYATELGIDVEDFKKEFTDPKNIDKINGDIETGLRSGVNGTPTIYINGFQYDGDPYHAKNILNFIDEILNDSK